MKKTSTLIAGSLPLCRLTVSDLPGNTMVAEVEDRQFVLAQNCRQLSTNISPPVDRMQPWHKLSAPVDLEIHFHGLHEV
jgi:hypothetical protein